MTKNSRKKDLSELEVSQKFRTSATCLHFLPSSSIFASEALLKIEETKEGKKVGLYTCFIYLYPALSPKDFVLIKSILRMEPLESWKANSSPSPEGEGESHLPVCPLLLSLPYPGYGKGYHIHSQCKYLQDSKVTHEVFFSQYE